MNIPIENIYFLLCYAWNKLEEKDIVNINAADHTKIVNLFARVLITGSAHLLRRGMDRNYVKYENDINTVKGKINFQECIKRNLISSAKINCAYDEFHHNILHNQILKATIRNLINVKDIDETYRDELIYFLYRFHEINNLILEKKHFSKITLHRNNYFYDFLLKICELIFDNLLISEEKGESKFRNFLQDEVKMRMVFEEFLRNFYKMEQSTFNVKREIIKWDLQVEDRESKEMFPEMETDISLESKNRKIIIDAKYYRDTLQTGRFGKKTIRSDNLNQLVIYLKNIESKGGINETCEGILIYPTVDEELEIRNIALGHKVSLRTINLNQNWQNIHSTLLSFIQ